MSKISAKTDGLTWTFENYAGTSMLDLARQLIDAGYAPDTEFDVWREETFAGNCPVLGMAAIPPSARLAYLRNRREGL